jgi:hypothetical protein
VATERPMPTPGCLWYAKGTDGKSVVRIVRCGKTRPTLGGTPQTTVTFVRISGAAEHALGKEVRAPLNQFELAFQPVRPA